MSTLAGLFPEITNWGFPTQSFNPKVVSSVTLPDNRQYVLRYNRYGELARVTLPTGGRIEYTYQAGQPSIAASGAIPGAPPVIYRRVAEKKTFTSAGSSTPVTWTVFGQEDDTSPDPIFGGNSQSIAVQHKDPGSGNVLSEEQHYFFGRSSDNLFSSTPLDYPVWRHGREYRTEILSGGNVVRAVDNTWAQRPCSGPWCGNPNHDEPAVDPRLMATTTTLSDAGLVSQQLFNYDTYNNRTGVSEYAFGAGSAGALVRRRETDYLTFFGSGNYATDFNIHLRRLPLQERTFDSIGIERARTTYEYDSYSTDAPTTPSWATRISRAWIR